MTTLPLWFKSLVYTEIFVQLPFFFVGIYAFIGALAGAELAGAELACTPPPACGHLAPQPRPAPPAPAAKKNWIRTPALVYSSFVVATMVPILAELAAHRAPGYNPLVVTAFYLPYLLVPLLILGKMAASREPFPSTPRLEQYQHYKWA